VINGVLSFEVAKQHVIHVDVMDLRPKFSRIDGYRGVQVPIDRCIMYALAELDTDNGRNLNHGVVD
jgi:hypothetical protein